MALTAKQARFVAEYLVDLNASAAARRAGYSPKTAGQIGDENLKKPEIAEAVNAAIAKRSARTELTADAVIAELWKIGSSNMMDYVRIGSNGDPFIDLSALDRDRAAAIAEVTVEDFKDGRGEDARDVRRVKFKLHDKKGALTDLGRHFGLFTDNLALSGQVQVDGIDRPPRETRQEWEARRARAMGSTTGAAD
jgi:phage terminase small subunit